MKCSKGEDLARILTNLTRGEERRPNNRESNNNRLQNENADEPADHRPGSILLRFGGEKLLIHRLIAEHEQACRKKEFERASDGEVAEHLEMRRGQRGSNRRPTTGNVREDGERNNERDGSEHADGKVHVGDRTHAGDSGEDDDEGGDDLLAMARRDRGEDQVEDIAAADELIAGNGGVREKNSNDAENAGGLVVTGLKQIGDGELRKLSRAWRNEVDDQKAGPTACGLPESREAVLIGVLGAGKQRAGADPRAQKRENKDNGGQRPAGNKVVGLCFYLGDARQRDPKQSENDEAENNRVKIHGLGTSVLAGAWFRYRRMRFLYSQVRRRLE